MMMFDCEFGRIEVQLGEVWGLPFRYAKSSVCVGAPPNWLRAEIKHENKGSRFRVDGRSEDLSNNNNNNNGGAKTG